VEWLARGNDRQQWPTTVRTGKGQKERVFSTFGNGFEKTVKGAYKPVEPGHRTEGTDSMLCGQIQWSRQLRLFPHPNC